MKIKICGLRTVSNVEAAVEAGADAIGFVFARSVRQVSVDSVRDLLAAARGVQRVAVFRRPEPSVLAAVMALGFDAIQADAAWEPPRLPKSVFFLPSFRDEPQLQEKLAAFPLMVRGDGLRGMVLVDGPAGGGMGVQADRRRVEEVARCRPIVLAGGLTPANVAQAVAQVHPAGVDVSSGVECAPGRKDPDRIRAFIAAVRLGGVQA